MVFVSGQFDGAGAGDPPGADGPRGHVSPHMLLPPAGRRHPRQLRRTQNH